MSSDPAVGSSDGQLPAGGYFASLTSARYLSLTTVGRDGTLVSTAVRVANNGDRVYISLWRASKTWYGLCRTDWVQVAPCTMLGICRYGPPLDATARPLNAEEARLASRMLAGKYRLQHRLLIPLRHRILGRHSVHYDLRPAEDAPSSGQSSP